MVSAVSAASIPPPGRGHVIDGVDERIVLLPYSWGVRSATPGDGWTPSRDLSEPGRPACAEHFSRLGCVQATPLTQSNMGVLLRHLLSCEESLSIDTSDGNEASLSSSRNSTAALLKPRHSRSWCTIMPCPALPCSTLPRPSSAIVTLRSLISRVEALAAGASVHVRNPLPSPPPVLDTGCAASAAPADGRTSKTEVQAARTARAKEDAEGADGQGLGGSVGRGPGGEGLVVLVQVVCSCLRHLRYPRSRLLALNLLVAFGRFCDDEARLQRLVPVSPWMFGSGIGLRALGVTIPLVVFQRWVID